MTLASPVLPRLAAASLAALPVAVEKPRYDRAAVTTGIVHLGIGAFHRAHQAVYTDDVLATGDTRWGIVGASLRSPDTRDALNPQGGLYTLAVRGNEGERLRLVGAIRDVLVAPESPQALLDALCRPSVAIVSLTVTEKGYCHDPATGALDERHPDIVHDLARPDAPRSAIGFLVRAVARRRELGLKPFTVLSCDNLPSNGRTLHRILSRYAALVSPELGTFVAGEIACPDTMVDRIVPATTDEDRARIAAALGAADAWPVVTEPFTQWVIEDRFASGRPAWEAAGATLVADVAPYETMKLRLLNGSHSALAYLGYLAGRETVAAAMDEPGIAAFVAALMDDTAPTLALPPGADVEGYKRSLVARFRNAALRHRTWQIAMDGSQKLPQRLLATIRDRLAKGLPVERHALGVAAWMRYVTGVDEQGRPIDLRDPLAADLAAAAREAGPVAERLAPALLGIKSIFGEDLPADARLRAAIVGALAALYRQGAAATAAAYARGAGGAMGEATI
ncbi:mannitol dehydrogenase family protein [Chelatococcus sp. SYSU_G07232]|uniref:Mannitol dehydrogenase family protein n=1 Tax=Chelatococcus albus TaxID=3047466 RepID=A0ABT7ALE2_9HYPH|nr:mannitol dehydrogenase family protein [Chelatococcus sp. SYSU_G07232]MDJ1160178.1 mannitol dehydrogenase family protein [Chelatococcus sp. SYSU_G07232]